MGYIEWIREQIGGYIEKKVQNVFEEVTIEGKLYKLLRVPTK